MMLQPHEERVVQEKLLLDDKIASLQQFISNSTIFNTLDIIDRNLLEEQYHVMIQYSKILKNRIEKVTKQK